MLIYNITCFTHIQHSDSVFLQIRCHLFVFYIYESVYVLLYTFVCINFLDSIWKLYYIVFVFLCMSYFTNHSILYIHSLCQKWQNVILFQGSVVFHCVYMCVCIYICIYMCVCVLVAQSCPTLCNPIDRSPTRPLCPWDSTYMYIYICVYIYICIYIHHIFFIHSSVF